MRMRSAAVALVLAAGVVVPAVATAGAALAKPADKPAAAQKGKPAKPVKPTKPTKPAKPTKPVKAEFTATGSAVAVDAAAGTVTVAAKGGTKDVRGRTVVVTVPSTAKVVVDEVPGTLADVDAGYKVTVKGHRTGETYTALRVQASAPEPDQDDAPEPVESPAPVDGPESGS